MVNKNLDNVFVEDVRIIADELSDFHDDLKGKTVLIAGGKGFLGTYFKMCLPRLMKHYQTQQRSLSWIV